MTMSTIMKNEIRKQDVELFKIFKYWLSSASQGQKIRHSSNTPAENRRRSHLNFEMFPSPYSSPCSPFVMDSYRSKLVGWLLGSGSTDSHEQGERQHEEGSKMSSSVYAPTAADQLSISNGIIGLIADTFQTVDDIGEFNTDPSGQTAALQYTKGAVQALKLTIQVVYKCLRHAELGKLQHPNRLVHIALDIIIALLTESILAMSEIGTVLVDIAVEMAALDIENPGSICPRYARQLKRLGSRIRGTEVVLSKIASVLQVGDEPEAWRHRDIVEEKGKGLIESSIQLSERLEQLQDEFGARALVSKERLEKTNMPAPRQYGRPKDDEELPDYSTATTGDQVDVSTPGDTDRNSIFSGLTLADLSSLSLIALPLNSAELKYGKFYTNDYCRSVSEPLEALSETSMKQKARAMSKVLGLREPGTFWTDQSATRMAELQARNNPEVQERAVASATRRASFFLRS